MILTDVQGYVRSERRVSLAQLSLRFGIAPDALRGMLDRLVAKGRAPRLPRPTRCAGCKVCPEAAREFYEWAKAAPSGPPPACGVDFAPEAREHCRCGTTVPAPRDSADAPRGQTVRL